MNGFLDIGINRWMNEMEEWISGWVGWINGSDEWMQNMIDEWDGWKRTNG